MHYAIFVVLIFLDRITEMQSVLESADVLLAVIGIKNIITLILSGKHNVVTLADYVYQSNEGNDPVFHIKDASFENAEYWE